jgi:hypothetical protein
VSGLERLLCFQLPSAGERCRDAADPHTTEGQSEKREEKSFGPVARGEPLHSHGGSEQAYRREGQEEEHDASNAQVHIARRASAGAHRNLSYPRADVSTGVSARAPHSAQAPS